MNPSIEVYVATHKPIEFALPDYCRKIQVNAEANGQWPGYLHDNDGSDNISFKNPNYCELTVLYSMWKNCKADIQGLYHYRRYMMKVIDKAAGRFDDYLKTAYLFTDEVKTLTASRGEITEALRDSDIILTAPMPRYPLDCMETFAHVYTHPRFINIMRKVIRDYWPDYLSALHEVFDGESMSVCNMFIAGKKVSDGYCEWLFAVMSKIEDLISQDKELASYSRVRGYLSEILLNVYVMKNNLRVKYFYRALVSREGNESRTSRALRNIPFAVKMFRAVKRMIKQRHHEETRESEKFSVRIRTFIGFNIYGPLFVAELTPKTDDIVPALEEIIPALKSEAEKRGMLFVPRVIIPGEIPDSLSESLWDMGIRIKR